ncbi:amino acid adenylation domain-containing protein [Streptomyces populi]|uniref:amino acid adenylation domain-containing protein n=1 Tax=Streptomyces populi TaxID=2058924 RepID=UPI001F0C6D24|nr:amino acid adenylation domain-containing protein [Streptomyces populi]
MSRANSLVLPGLRRIDADEVGRRLDGLRAPGPVSRGPVLWTETLPYPSHDPRAERLRLRTTGRPVAPPDGPAVRVCLLTYTDQVQDLVVSARPEALDEAGLAGLACLLVERSGTPDPGPVVLPEPVGTTAAEPAERLSLEWASGADGGPGSRGSRAVALPSDDAPRRGEAVVVAALAAALARRTGGTAPPLTVRRPGPAGESLARTDSAATVLLRSPASATVEARAAAARRILRDAHWAVGPVPAHDVELRLPVPPATRLRLEAAGLGLSSRTVPAPESAVLAFRLDSGPDAHELSCDFAADLVASEAVEALLTEVARAVGEASEDPGPGGSRAGTASAGGGPALGAETTIHDLVTERAAAHPDAVAVTAPDRELTYGQLDLWAETIGDSLRSRGIGAGHRVGVCLTRGAELVATLLGVLKSGAAYVPIDPSSPEDRVRYLARDAGLSHVLTHRSDGAFAGCPHSAPPSATDGPADGGARAADGAPRSGSRDPAYVIYTSGSTGRPKGVVVEHRNFAALLAGTREEFRFTGHDVWTFFHSFAFDFSVWEIWGCLATGGRLVVVPEDVARVPEEFRELLHGQRVTVLNQTPSAFVQLLSTETAGAAPLDVRLLVFGGEPLDSRTLLPWFDAHPEDRCRVVNMYGITETTVHCTWTDLTRRDALANSRSIGVALPGWTLHVLDPHGRPLPPGVPGEIHVGGAGVARCYHGRSGLTAQRFRPDHLSGVPGARLYRTGDRGRLRHDGRLEHLGRLDGQVKVRGYRIELDEIRNCLLEAAEVRGAAVVLRHRGEAGDAHLDAYVVGPQADPAALREHLERTLPGYMVPSTLTVLPSMPVTGNGKLDVERLPEPGHRPSPPRPAGTTEQPVPSGRAPAEPDVASRIAGAWHEVLGTPVTPDDNFFLVGGNSLLAIRVMVRLREQGITDAPVRMLYRHPTVRRLAEALTAQ